MHLGPHGRVQSIGADQQLRPKLALRTARSANERRDAIGVVAVADDTMPGEHRAGSETLDRRAVEQHLQAAAMHSVLRPTVTGEKTARLGVHVLAVQSYERPLAGRQTDRVQLGRADTELV